MTHLIRKGSRACDSAALGKRALAGDKQGSRREHSARLRKRTPVSADRDNATPEGPHRGLRAKLWVPALLMALVVGVIWSPNLLRPPPPAWTVYSNVKGQIRRIVLTDKSVVRLNGASQVRVVYEDDVRRAAMGQAEAAFTMTPTEHYPFRISSGDRVVEMDGGEINLLRETSQNSARTVLTVRQGQARVYPEDRAAEAIAVGPGQEVSWSDGQDPPAVRAVNAANAFAWESHRLAYDKAPLSEVVADLNRYVARPIRILDPAVGQMTFTGVLNLEGEDMMLRRIGAVLPVVAKPRAAEIVLQRGQSKPVKAKKAPLMQSLLKLGGKPRLLPKPAPPKTPAPSKTPAPPPVPAAP
jgi:transmembrane sensor